MTLERLKKIVDRIYKSAHKDCNVEILFCDAEFNPVQLFSFYDVDESNISFSDSIDEGTTKQINLICTMRDFNSFYQLPLKKPLPRKE